jgi:protein SMG9
MAKPQQDRSAEFPSLQQATTVMQKQRTPALAAVAAVASQDEDSTRSDSPAPSSTSSSAGKQQQKTDAVTAVAVEAIAPAANVAEAAAASPAPGGTDQMKEQDTPVKLVDNYLSRFNDMVRQFLGDGTDFLVVGVVGLQGTGKSTLLSAFGGGEGAKFKTQTFYDHQMNGEHCSNGITVHVCARTRVLLIDTQPICSASVLDRNMMFEKKQPATPLEFGSSENTVEMHSLQMLGFLMTVCHVVLLAQDWFADTQLIRTVQTAEMLRPTSTTYASDDDSEIIEYFPDLVFVHNKAELDDFTSDRMAEMQSFYETAFRTSQLHVSTGINMPDLAEATNLFLLPDQEAEENKGSSFATGLSFQDSVAKLRRAVYAAPRRRMSTVKVMTEKGWLAFAANSWDAIKNSPLYQEYNRLMQY